MSAKKQVQPTDAQFDLAVVPDRERVFIVPRGELDLATTGTVETQALAFCQRGFRDLCLDLTSLTFFDSSALRLLVRLDDELSRRGGRFSIVPGDGPARRVLELTSMLDRFEHAER